jgi:hypothetical protein
VGTPAVISGTSNSSFPAAPTSCLRVLNPGSGSKTVTWNTGQTSTFSYNKVSSNVGSNVVTETGIITSGLFAGSTAVETVTGAADTLQCLSPPGLTDRFELLNLVITRL